MNPNPHPNKHPWNTQMEEELFKVIREFPDDYLGVVEHRKEKEFMTRQNLSFGVTVGFHHETDGEIFQFNDDRFRHTVILGRTGSGKSNHLQQMEREDILGGAGCFILAAHEDDALYPLSCVPEERWEDAILVDASNPEYLPRMNPLDVSYADPAAVSKAVSDAMELLTMDCPYDWAGPRFEDLLRNGVGLMLMSPNANSHYLAGLNQLFVDPMHVKDLLEYCDNRDIYDFWTKIYPEELKSRESGELIQWFLAKVRRFSDDYVLKHVFGAGHSTIDMQEVVDEGKILVAYIPETRIGSVAARTLSRWLVMQLRDAIMNRRESAEGWRGMNYGAYEGGSCSGCSLEPFFVYVDEFAKFASSDFEILLAEARKKHVGFVLSTQTLSQTRTLDRKTGQIGQLEEAVLGNVGSLICYPVGVRDAEVLSRQFDVEVEKLKRIEKYKPLARLCVDNQICPPITLEVGQRPDPARPDAPRWIAENMATSGMWAEVDGAESKGGFLRAIEGK